ncbi:MAG: D-glutamate deacylase, partial [Gammaproteobacteria bacterium]|nr:D-glutamate deacylase [Gemmatimonadota bacterium]NIR40315.1 D-glutamate deacylase [Actinomycetota bacterium]NIU75950.1 D-glutamate deacylase [Gammaproteobacteria bacterium]NIX24073.1 D-glutamate deacylase [Actinomycetota bacterium]
HIRYAGLLEPESSIAAVQEMIADAAGSNGSVHIVHIGSSGLQQIPVLLEMIDAAHEEGVDVTTEVYPYTAASTGIRAAIFDPGWRERLGGDYGDIEWIATG